MRRVDGVSGAAPAGADPEAAYYQAIEEFFVSRRGDPLFLSNADWLLIRSWRQARVPLRVVLRGITNALDAHRVSWSRKRKVGSLAYCAAEVDAARERWERALALGEQEGLDASSVLMRFAESLEAAHDLGSRSAEEADRLARELRLRAASPGSTGDLEGWLAQQERKLVDALRRDAGNEHVGSLEASVDADLAPYRSRMPARVLTQIRAESITRRLLEAHGVPRLSLFHLVG